MKNSLTKQLGIFTCLFALLFAFIPATGLANESELPEAQIYFDGKPYKTKYAMGNGHLLVPAQFLKHAGVLVDWDPKWRSVVFQAKGIKFAAPVGEKFTDDYDRRTGTWKRGVLATEPFEFDGKVFIPLIDVVRKLDMGVRYDAKSNRTYITTNIPESKKLISSVKSSKKLVALTFDDGPEDYYTPMILDVLKEKGVPATFFVMGEKVNQYPDMMKRIVNEGHSFGNHTWSHPNLKQSWSADVRKEIQSTQQVLERVIGKKSDLFRPPYGAVTKADRAALSQMGLRGIGWSVDTLDWSGMSAERILEIVRNQTAPGGIMLQHNFQAGGLLDGTVEALPQIIDELSAQGYTFVTIQTLLDSGEAVY
ncbi:polysaccharide deacetylase family protein [Niallia sp. XMNu-256]|uniref:polysaccharide deacetylase family protein n=1 Tax=Niallia sp. XMNu-256 TaxID=3082444 RepID=UPI0030D241E3